MMPNVLVPMTEFDTSAITRTVIDIVETEKEVLLGRQLHGVVARYGKATDEASDDTEKRANVHIEAAKAQHVGRELGAFAVTNAGADIVGIATITPSLKLRSLRLPLPVQITRHSELISPTYPCANPNITAWTRSENQNELQSAYEQLIEKSYHFFKKNERDRIWTIEPQDSPNSIHEALVAADLTPIGNRRFDDEELNWDVMMRFGKYLPGRSILYVHGLSGSWDTSWGRLRELRRGIDDYLHEKPKRHGWSSYYDTHYDKNA